MSANGKKSKTSYSAMVEQNQDLKRKGSPKNNDFIKKSTLKNAIINSCSHNTHNIRTYKGLCQKLNIKYYATNNIYKQTNELWEIIHEEMIGEIGNEKTNNLTYHEIIEYLSIKHENALYKNKLKYLQMINILQDYTIKYNKFLLNNIFYIRRLKSYKESRKCCNMSDIIYELDEYLKIFILNEDPEDTDNQNTYKRQDWIIISRYICDFIEDMAKFNKLHGIEWQNPLFD